MKISLDWLKDYVDIDVPAEQLAQLLSDLGFPTEGIEYIDDDTVIDIEVSSNRGDCLSHIGIARELAAVTGKKLRLPRIQLPQSKEQTSRLVEVSISAPQLCGRYTARIIHGVKVGPSPQWMINRLGAVGIRSVNNVVDATNYAMMEIGQPPHAFDFEKINGGKIIVRNAQAGEQLVSIDETKCDLDIGMLVIADAQKVVAIAGVMGGLDTEINPSTSTVLLEDALFDPVSVRTTGRKLGISSEALFRFERQVDIENIDWASQRAAALIIKVAGGLAATGVVDTCPAGHETKTVGMRFSRLNKLLGIEIGKDVVMNIFAGLGFEPQVKENGSVVCTVPTWRHDIYREVDLIEEVARCHGYDKIPTEQRIQIEVAPLDKREKTASRLRTFLTGCGFYESINVTFVSNEVASLFAEADQQDHITIRDESGKSANLLRQNLTGSLLGVLKSNYNAKNIPCRVFELADTFSPGQPQSQDRLPVERTKLGIVIDSNFRELRGIIEGLIKVTTNHSDVEFVPIKLNWAAAAARIEVAGRTIGTAGIISPKIAEKFDLEAVEVCAAELDFESLLEIHAGDVTVKPIPRFPAITRDLSLIVDEKTCWSDITEVVKSNAPDELQEIDFVGIYRGKPIADGKKSVTISLRFRDEDGTLRHEVVDEFENKIFGGLSDSLNAELRTV